MSVRVLTLEERKRHIFNAPSSRILLDLPYSLDEYASVKGPTRTRRVAVAVVGDLRSEAIPVFLHTGMGGGRHLSWLLHDIAFAYGIKLIVPDRPGYGLSDPWTSGNADTKQRGTFVQWADYVPLIADALDIDQFAQIGISCGCVYAMAVTHRHRERLLPYVALQLFAPWIMPSEWECSMVIKAASAVVPTSAFVGAVELMGRISGDPKRKEMVDGFMGMWTWVWELGHSHQTGVESEHKEHLLDESKPEKTEHGGRSGSIASRCGSLDLLLHRRRRSSAEISLEPKHSSSQGGEGGAGTPAIFIEDEADTSQNNGMRPSWSRHRRSRSRLDEGGGSTRNSRSLSTGPFGRGRNRRQSASDVLLERPSSTLLGFRRHSADHHHPTSPTTQTSQGSPTNHDFNAPLDSVISSYLAATKLESPKPSARSPTIEITDEPREPEPVHHTHHKHHHHHHHQQQQQSHVTECSNITIFSPTINAILTKLEAISYTMLSQTPPLTPAEAEHVLHEQYSESPPDWLHVNVDEEMAFMQQRPYLATGAKVDFLNCVDRNGGRLGFRYKDVDWQIFVRHGTEDSLVGVKNARDLARRCRWGFKEIAGATHAVFSITDCVREAFEAILAAMRAKFIADLPF